MLAGRPVDMPLDVLFGKPPRMTRDVRSVAKPALALPTSDATIAESLDRVLRLPAVADKTFLITIGDRTVGGLDQPRPDGRPVAGAGGRCRGHACPTTRVTAAKPWRWESARQWRCSMRRLRGGSRSPSRSPTSLRPTSGACRYPFVGELDGGLRRARRGRRSLRHRARRRRRALRRARYHDSGGQGFALDAHGVDRCGRCALGDRAHVARRIGVRAGVGRAAHPHAGARCIASPRGSR